MPTMKSRVQQTVTAGEAEKPAATAAATRKGKARKAGGEGRGHVPPRLRVRLPPDLRRHVDAVSALNGLTRGEIVRDAVRASMADPAPEAARHWTEYTAPSSDASKAQVAAPYDHTRHDVESPEGAAVILGELYDEWRSVPFESGIANFHALFQLMRHNPHFGPEVEALRMMLHGESVLNQFAGKVSAM